MIYLSGCQKSRLLCQFERVTASEPQKSLSSNSFRIDDWSWSGLAPWFSGQRIHLQCRRHRRLRFDLWVGEISQRKNWLPTPVFFPGQSHGQRSFVGYSSKGHNKSDTTEQLEGKPSKADNTILYQDPEIKPVFPSFFTSPSRSATSNMGCFIWEVPIIMFLKKEKMNKG